MILSLVRAGLLNYSVPPTPYLLDSRIPLIKHQTLNTASNMSATNKGYPPGIHVPSLTFFSNNARQDIDWEVQEAHMEFLISSGLHGSELAIAIYFSLWHEKDLER